ncbi:hypothetical protein N9478_10700 [Gammaproteobacteria bacterium]|nr:hypothetical protein [Gammaproteobacteria bacterium]
MVKDDGWRRNFTVVYALISGYFLYDFSSNDADESLVIGALMWIFYLPIAAIISPYFESDEGKGKSKNSEDKAESNRGRVNSDLKRKEKIQQQNLGGRKIFLVQRDKSWFGRSINWELYEANDLILNIKAGEEKEISLERKKEYSFHIKIGSLGVYDYSETKKVKLSENISKLELTHSGKLTIKYYEKKRQ